MLSSPAMETKALEILWERSLDHKFRYYVILSNGESSVFDLILKLEVYAKGLGGLARGI